VKFSHENFKRDKKELLSRIYRSTHKGANTDNSKKQKCKIESLEEEIVVYKGKVMTLTDRVTYLENKFCHIDKQLEQLLNSRSMKCKFKQDRMSSIDGQKYSRGVSATYLKHPSTEINITLTPNKTVHQCRQSFTHNNNVPNTFHLASLPTLLPHPKTKNGLPTLPPHPKTQNGTLLGILRTDERILSLSRDISLPRCLSNVSDLLPVLENIDMDIDRDLGFKPDRISSIDGQKCSRGFSGTYLKLPSIEMNVPPTPNKTVCNLTSLPTLPPHPKTQSGTLPDSLRIKRVLSLSRDISLDRCWSNASDLLPGILFMMDEKNDAQNKTVLDDGTTTTSSSN